MPDEELLSPAEIKEIQRQRENEAFYQNQSPQESENYFAPSHIRDMPQSAEKTRTPTSDARIEDAEFINNLVDNAQPLVWPALLALSGFVVRTIVTKKKTSPVEFLLDCLAAIIIGAMVGIAIEDMHFSQNIRYAIIGIAGISGRIWQGE